MRSRYAAYARQEADYLLATWHPSTRPASPGLDPGLTWLRLEVLDSQRGASGDDDSEVEFRAHYRRGRVLGSLHERSRFTRRGGRWLYLDGDVS